MVYNYKKIIDEDRKEYIELRHELALQRIREIRNETLVGKEYADFFRGVAEFLDRTNEIVMSTISGEYYTKGIAAKEHLNRDIYAELSGDGYDKTYLNPNYSCEKFGRDLGQLLSAVYAELRSVIVYAYSQNLEQLLIRDELFLEIYGLFEQAFTDGEEVKAKSIIEIFSSFAFDYLDFMMEESVVDGLLNTNSLPYNIVMQADLSDCEYLYDYGEYISDIEVAMSKYMAMLSDEEIQSMADTYTEGYRKGFIATGKDLSIKKYVEIRYFIGFERVVRAAVDNFTKMGLKSVIHYSTSSFMLGRGVIKRGIESTSPCKQFESDHEQDKVIYFDHAYMERKIESYRDALERHKDDLALYAGPAVIEAFGEEAFTPGECKGKLELDDSVRGLLTQYSSRAGELLNRYIKGEERSFTIIAFPTPAIGDKFEEIFKETIAINTLNYEKYRDLQQIIIDTLDTTDKVHIAGMNGNKTDLVVKLWELDDVESETKFENCVADVNIPVGEVFTSPVLKGTEGVLHVKEVFLNGIQFVDLTIVFKDGIVDNITCGNYADENENKKFIDRYILFNHKTLPMGEFAIGTNTVAYKATKKYNLGGIMPILIAEKTGPHFALGDTCYSHEEEVVTYNPDGKRIVARENDYSILRETKPQEAYFNCHTDITIPYDELAFIDGIRTDGSTVRIIENGKFVLRGLEELNKPLED